MKVLATAILILAPLFSAPLLAQAAPVAAPTASSTLRIKDVTKLNNSKGEQINGTGLVLGLSATGTTDDLLAAQLKRDLDRNLGADPNRRLRDQDFASNNIASVMVSAELNFSTTRRGNVFTAIVSANRATSLKNGELVQTQLKDASGRLFANASGKITVDPQSLTRGRVQAVLLEDIDYQVFDRVVEADAFGTTTERREIKLFLETEDLGTATNIEKAINFDSELNGTIGTADDVRDAPKIAFANAEGSMVTIQIPRAYWGDEADFINKVQQLTVNVDSVAMIVINESANIVTFTKEVTLLGGTITVGGVSITVPGDGQMPTRAQPGDVLVDPVVNVNANDSTNALNDLIQLFQILNLTAEEKRSVVRELHASGRIRGHLVER